MKKLMRLSVGLSTLSMILLSCGDEPVAPLVDSGTVRDSRIVEDSAPTCSCNTTLSDIAKQFVRSTSHSGYTFSAGGALAGGAVNACLEFEYTSMREDSELIGISCVIESGPREHESGLILHGPAWKSPDELMDPVYWPPAASMCIWQDIDNNPGQWLINQITCLAPESEDACIDTSTSNHYIVDQIQPGSIIRNAVGCESGFMVAGGCTNTELPRPVTVLSAGPNDAGEWECVYKNDWSLPVDIITSVQCLEFNPIADAPAAQCDCCPSFENVLYRTTNSLTLNANGVTKGEVTCNDTNDVMIIGGCSIVDDMTGTPELGDITMFRSGFINDIKDPIGDLANVEYNVWGCGWDNPTMISGSANASAVCLDVN